MFTYQFLYLRHSEIVSYAQIFLISGFIYEEFPIKQVIIEYRCP